MVEHPDYNVFHVAFVIVSADLVRGLKDICFGGNAMHTLV